MRLITPRTLHTTHRRAPAVEPDATWRILLPQTAPRQLQGANRRHRRLYRERLLSHKQATSASRPLRSSLASLHGRATLRVIRFQHVVDVLHEHVFMQPLIPRRILALPLNPILGLPEHPMTHDPLNFVPTHPKGVQQRLNGPLILTKARIMLLEEFQAAFVDEIRRLAQRGKSNLHTAHFTSRTL